MIENNFFNYLYYIIWILHNNDLILLINILLTLKLKILYPLQFLKIQLKYTINRIVGIQKFFIEPSIDEYLNYFKKK